jgi:YbbR domain-containing protein
MSARNLILNNFWLKSFSLVLATMIWMAIHYNLQTESSGEQNAVRSPNYHLWPRPIMLVTAADDHRAYVVDPLTVNVKVNGDSEVLKKLNANDIQVFVDLTAVSAVHGAFPVDVKLPRNVALESVWPSHVHIEPAKEPAKPE